MKKTFSLVLGLILSVAAWAQCPTETTPTYPVPVDSSLLTINGERRADCDAYIKGHYNPLYIHRCGTPTNGYTTPSWFYGLLCESDVADGGYNMGVVGRVLNNGGHSTSGRAYGVYGTAFGYASGYTYGILGRLEGSRNGAGIYGTSYQSDEGVNTGGRYAGFFHGNVRVTDTLKTAVLHSNALLAPNVSGSGLLSAASACSADDAAPTTCEKLDALSAYTYMPEQPVVAAALEADEDTIDYASLNLHDAAYYSRPHHGLSAEEVMEVYPELVFDNLDGTKSVNYLELIPILLDAIKELRSEVEVLKGNTPSSPQYSSRRASEKTDGIGQAAADKSGTGIATYNLQGQRISSSSINAVVIENGKKTIKR